MPYPWSPPGASVRTASVGNPGNGNPANFVPSLWTLVVAFEVTDFVCSATVTTRRPRVDFLDAAANLFCSIYMPGSVLANADVSVVGAMGVTATASITGFGDGISGNSIQTIALPILLVPPSGTFRITADNLQAGDSFQGIKLRVEEWNRQPV